MVWLYIIMLVLSYIFSIMFFSSITHMRFPKYEMAFKKATGMFLFSLVVLAIIGYSAFNLFEKNFFIWFGCIILWNLFAEMRIVKRIKKQ
jgi:hypothetical protein